MKSITPLVQMEPHILGEMPVFKDTLVPIKRMFDYLLAGRGDRSTGERCNGFLRGYQQGDGFRRDAFFAAEVAQLFVGLGFDVDLADVHTQIFGDVGAH